MNHNWYDEPGHRSIKWGGNPLKFGKKIYKKITGHYRGEKDLKMNTYRFVRTMTGYSMNPKKV